MQPHTDEPAVSSQTNPESESIGNRLVVNSKPVVHFPWAEQPDIIRSAQKDEFHKHSLSTQAFDVFRQLLGPRRAMQWKEEVQLISDTIYYGLSTLVDTQTLGEEYCDIMQVKASRVTPLVGWKRLVLMLLHVLVPYMYNKILQQLMNLSRPQPSNLSNTLNPSSHTLTNDQRKILEKYLPHISKIFVILSRIHIAVFFFSGVYYDVSKRIVDVRYIFNRKLDEDRPRYTILGILIFLQLGISLFMFIKQTIFPPPKKVEIDLSKLEEKVSSLVSSTTCSLCLEPRKFPTCTTCGHIFCWNCIVEWCNNKAECPLCRAPQKKNQLVCVYGI